MSWEKGTDLELLKSMLESADIDFEEISNNDNEKVYIEISNGIIFTFEEDGVLEEISNG